MIPAIILRWPDSKLNPNSHCHWSVKAKAAKAYRKDAGWLAVTSKVKVDREGSIHLKITFLPPSNRKYDLDNLLARIKSGLDGVADGLGVNDNRFALTIERGVVCPPGWVRIEVIET
jgi:crossover junction endodeoxyribonuclease RusA